MGEHGNIVRHRTAGSLVPHRPIHQPLSQPPPQSSLRSVSLVTGLTVVQLLVQFVLQLLLAKYFGAGDDMDAYVAALALPIVVSMILSGSLGYVLVPIFAEQLAAGGERAATAVSSQIGLYLLFLTVAIAAAAAAFARPIAGLLCPGFSPSQLALTAQLLRISSLLIVANSLISFLNSLYHCVHRFAQPAAAGVVGTLITVAYVAALHRQGIHAVAWGVVLGAAVTAGLLLPLLAIHLAASGTWRQPPHEATRRSLWLLLPLVVGAVFWRLDPLLDRLLGSYLPTGSIAHLGYAWRLANSLSLIGGSGLAIVAFRSVVSHAAAGNRDSMNAEVAHAWRLLAVVLIPVACGLVVFSEPVTRLLFERGRFTPDDTRAVATLVTLYVGVVVGAGAGDLLSRSLYALHDTRTPVLVGMIAFGVGAAFKVLLVREYEAAGLAAATSLFYLVNAAALAVIVSIRLGGNWLSGTAACMLRSGAAAAAGCIAAGIVLRWLAAPWAVLPAAAVGAALYVVILWLLGDEFARRFARTVIGART
jgi:putative peptidoglycan lipid II flippase